jgi:hypothetical protein
LNHPNGADLTAGTGQTSLFAYGDVSNAGSATDTVSMVWADFDLAVAATVDNIYLLRAKGTFSGAGTCTNFAQLRLDDIGFGSATVTNKYGIWQADTELLNRLEGNTELNIASGELYEYDATHSVAIAVAGTWYEITSGLSSRNLYQTTLVTAHALQVARAGKYFITWSANFSGPTNATIEVGVIINSSTATVYAMGERRLNAAGDTGSASGKVILSLTASQEISMAVANETSTTSVVFEHISLCMFRIAN